MNFKKKSRSCFIIIFKLKNGNLKTRDFSPLIERVLAGVNETNSDHQKYLYEGEELNFWCPDYSKKVDHRKKAL